MLHYITLYLMFVFVHSSENTCSLCDTITHTHTPRETSVPLLAYFAFTLAGISAAGWFGVIFYYSYNKDKKN